MLSLVVLGTLCLLELLEKPGVHFILRSQLICKLLNCLLVVRISLIAAWDGNWLLRRSMVLIRVNVVSRLLLGRIRLVLSVLRSLNRHRIYVILFEFAW